MNTESLERRIRLALSQIDSELGGSEDSFVHPITGDGSASGLQMARRFLRALIASDPRDQIVVVRRSVFWGHKSVEINLSDPEARMTEGETK